MSRPPAADSARPAYRARRGYRADCRLPNRPGNNRMFTGFDVKQRKRADSPSRFRTSFNGCDIRNTREYGTPHHFHFHRVRIEYDSVEHDRNSFFPAAFIRCMKTR